MNIDFLTTGIIGFVFWILIQIFGEVILGLIIEVIPKPIRMYISKHHRIIVYGSVFILTIIVFVCVFIVRVKK